MEKTYKVYYENHYGKVNEYDYLVDCNSCTNDEIVIYEGSLEKCLNYLKTQMIDATLKFLDLDYNVDISRNIFLGRTTHVVISIEVSERHNEEFRMYESTYRLCY